MPIQLVQYNAINFHKWDNCISKSINGIVYAYSWYLDIVSGNWDALILDDYSAVFPLVKSKKLGIHYLYQPNFTQQLGLFSTIKIENRLLNDFINAIPAKYSHIKVNLNTFNECTLNNKVTNRVTYQLDLIQPYHILSSKFNENTQRNISKSVALGVEIIRGISIDEFIKFKVENMVFKLKVHHLNILQRIIAHSVEKGIGELYAAYSTKNELCAIAFFIRSNGKVIYLIAASNRIGKENRAMFRIVDHFIYSNSETNLVLDFEGSMVESIARFYAGFGATPCYYQQYVNSSLPWYIKPFFK